MRQVDRETMLARAAELEDEARILARDAPNRYRRSIADRRARAKALRESAGFTAAVLAAALLPSAVLAFIAWLQ